MPLNTSIRSRVTLFVATLALIVIGLAAFATVRLVAIDGKTEAIGATWFEAAHILDEVADETIRFRLAETYRALAADPAEREATELLASQHRDAIDRMLADYSALLAGDPLHGNLEAVRAAWNAYLAEHRAWIEADAAGALDEPARHGSALHRHYMAVFTALHELSDEARAAAADEVRAADELVDATIAEVIVLCAAVVALALWVLFRLRRNITQPLGAITAALSRLAAGDREVRVPEVERMDEIGEMAKAFDVFRANALALEQAHEATRAAQEQAQALARHDALTGLPNRRVFSAELETAIGDAQNGSAICSVLMIDLDRFKPVNDLQGHPIGDLVLIEVARRLREAVRKGDTVARLGGDEFAIVAECEPQFYPDQAIRLAGRILMALREPILIGDGRIEISGSIGIASCPADGADPETLLRAADIAMYRAKHDGRGSFRFFEQSMDEELRAQAALETDLRKAIENGEIRPHYQPLLEMRGSHIYGFEVLARWQHPERGAVRPDVFIPLAEQLGLIADLTWSMLRQACRDAKTWPDEIRLSVNISPIQLRDAAFPTQLLTALNQEHFPPSRLEIEITETALVSDIETAKLILSALQSVGIKVSLDDFGTGYSSLYHLRELKFDKVKIDRSFVQSMQENGESEKIVDAILSLARNLGLPTVAEGVENRAVLDHLTEMGCDYGQGFYFGKAISAEAAGQMLAAQGGARNVA